MPNALNRLVASPITLYTHTHNIRQPQLPGDTFHAGDDASHVRMRGAITVAYAAWRLWKPRYMSPQNFVASFRDPVRYVTVFFAYAARSVEVYSCNPDFASTNAKLTVLRKTNATESFCVSSGVCSGKRTECINAPPHVGTGGYLSRVTSEPPRT